MKSWYKQSQQKTHWFGDEFRIDQNDDYASLVENAENYTTNKIVFYLPFGWTIKEVGKEDEDIENEFIRMNSYVGKNRNIYSLRDPNNVPAAAKIIETTPEDPSYFGIIDNGFRYVGQGQELFESNANGMFKKWFDFLRENEIKPKHFEETYSVSKIRELKDMNMHDETGTPMFFSNVGGNADTYVENLKEAYNEGWGGSCFYKNVANNLADTIIEYAISRNELDEIESAAQALEEWGYDMWIENNYNIMSDVERPDEPEREDFMVYYQKQHGQLEFDTQDFEQTKKPFFNEIGYNEAYLEFKKAMTEYEKIEQERQEDFEPIAFANYVYHEVQSALKKQNPQKTP